MSSMECAISGATSARVSERGGQAWSRKKQSRRDRPREEFPHPVWQRQRARRVERRQFHRPPGPVFHRRQIEHPDVGLAGRVFAAARRSRGPPSRRSSRVRPSRARTVETGTARPRSRGRRAARSAATWTRMSRPAISTVRKVALLGRPIAAPVIASISSTV